jgi:hypothetical protein
MAAYPTNRNTRSGILPKLRTFSPQTTRGGVGLDKFEFIIGRSWIYGFMKMATDFFRPSTVSFVFANCFLSFLFSASSSAILLSLELSGFVACRTHLLMVGLGYT